MKQFLVVKSVSKNRFSSIDTPVSNFSVLFLSHAIFLPYATPTFFSPQSWAFFSFLSFPAWYIIFGIKAKFLSLAWNQSPYVSPFMSRYKIPKHKKKSLGSCSSVNMSSVTLGEKFEALMKNYQVVTSTNEEWKNQKEELKIQNEYLRNSWVITWNRNRRRWKVHLDLFMAMKKQVTWSVRQVKKSSKKS